MSTDARETSDRYALDDYVDDFGRRYASAIENADRPAPTQLEVARRARRFRRRTAAAIGVLAVSGLVAIVVLPSGDQLDIVEAANAALGSGNDLVHYRLRTDIKVPGTDLPTGGCSNGPVAEVWQTTTAPLRFRVRVPAQPKACSGDLRGSDGVRITGAQEWAFNGTTLTTYVPDLDRVKVVTGVSGNRMPVSLPGLQSQATDPVTALRDALDSGGLRVASRSDGRIALIGRTTETTRGGKRPSGLIIHHDLRYVVDASTFRPVRLSSTDTTYFFKGNGRPKDGKRVVRASITFDDYETRSLDSKSERLLSIHPVRPAVTTTSAGLAVRLVADVALGYRAGRVLRVLGADEPERDPPARVSRRGRGRFSLRVLDVPAVEDPVVATGHRDEGVIPAVSQAAQDLFCVRARNAMAVGHHADQRRMKATVLRARRHGLAGADPRKAGRQREAGDRKPR